jgi:acyl carrier protein
MTGPTSSRVPTPRELEEALAHFINATLLGGGTAVGPDTRLFEDGYINSLRILDLIAMIEKSLGRRIPDRAVRLSNFRTIATIVRAFHPDAASESPAEHERLFERRRDRSRFASPIPSLIGRGDLVVTGAGRVALSGLALDVLEAVDRTATRWAHSLGAPEHRYPSLIDAGVLARAGQTSGLVVRSSARNDKGARDDGAARNDSAVLSPAVCYHAYPERSGQTLGPTPTLLTARGHCYRHEDGNRVPSASGSSRCVKSS